MSTYYLINTTRLGTRVLWPGTLFDSTVDDTSAIAAAGGRLYASGNATVAAAALIAQHIRQQAGSLAEADAVMISAAGVADAAIAAAATAAASAAVAGAALTHYSVTLDFTTDAFSALSAGVKTKTKALGALGLALPANARFAGLVVGSGTFVGFDDATHGTYVVKVGSTTDDDAILATANVAAGQTGFPKLGTVGVRGLLGFPLYAEVVNLILTSSVDLNTVTAGTLTVDLLIQVLA